MDGGSCVGDGMDRDDELNEDNYSGCEAGMKMVIILYVF